MVQHRPWFEFLDRHVPKSAVHVFGYGPEFFQYLFPLEQPDEIVDPQLTTIYRSARNAHNKAVHRTVELGMFGLATYLFLLGAVLITGFGLLLRGQSTPFHKLVAVGLLASIGGRTVEQMVGVPNLSDVALFWVLLAVLVVLPGLTYRRLQPRGGPGAGGIGIIPSPSRFALGGTIPQMSLAVVLAAAVVAFTIVKNPNYALAANREATATASLEKGDLPRAIQQIDGAIVLAPDVGLYRVKRANILDRARTLSASQGARWQLAQEAYLANRHAVAANPFDVYARLNFAESALTLAGLGQVGSGEEAIEEYRRTTLMIPGYWLSHFLLGRAYIEMGRPGLAVEAFDVAIPLNPDVALSYMQRGLAHASPGEYQPAIDDYDEAIRLGHGLTSIYGLRGVAYFQQGRLMKAIVDYEEAIRINPRLASAYNNLGAAYHASGQTEQAIEAYDDAIRMNPRFTQAYVNRSFAYTLLNKNEEAKRDADRAVELGFDISALEEEKNP